LKLSVSLLVSTYAIWCQRIETDITEHSWNEVATAAVNPRNSSSFQALFCLLTHKRDTSLQSSNATIRHYSQQHRNLQGCTAENAIRPMEYASVSTKTVEYAIRKMRKRTYVWSPTNAIICWKAIGPTLPKKSLKILTKLICSCGNVQNSFF
jgi:hypothetical protein